MEYKEMCFYIHVNLENVTKLHKNSFFQVSEIYFIYFFFIIKCATKVNPFYYHSIKF